MSTKKQPSGKVLTAEAALKLFEENSFFGLTALQSRRVRALLSVENKLVGDGSEWEVESVATRLFQNNSKERALTYLRNFRQCVSDAARSRQVNLCLEIKNNCRASSRRMSIILYPNPELEKSNVKILKLTEMMRMLNTLPPSAISSPVVVLSNPTNPGKSRGVYKFHHQQNSADRALYRWAEERKQPSICLLTGEYGVGKSTSVARFIDAEMVKRNNQSPSRLILNLSVQWIRPSVIEEMFTRKSCNSIDLFSYFLQKAMCADDLRGYGTLGENFTTSDISEMLSDHSLLLVLDHIDVLLSQLKPEHVTRLLKLVHSGVEYYAGHRAYQDGVKLPPSRLLLVMRDSYFPSDQAACHLSLGEKINCSVSKSPILVIKQLRLAPEKAVFDAIVHGDRGAALLEDDVSKTDEERLLRFNEMSQKALYPEPSVTPNGGSIAGVTPAEMLSCLGKNYPHYPDLLSPPLYVFGKRIINAWRERYDRRASVERLSSEHTLFAAGWLAAQQWNDPSQTEFAWTARALDDGLKQFANTHPSIVAGHYGTVPSANKSDLTHSMRETWRALSVFKRDADKYTFISPLVGGVLLADYLLESHLLGKADEAWSIRHFSGPIVEMICDALLLGYHPDLMSPKRMKIHSILSDLAAPSMPQNAQWNAKACASRLREKKGAYCLR